MNRVSRRMYWLPVLPLTLALVLSACGGQQTSPSAEGSEAPPATGSAD